MTTTGPLIETLRLARGLTQKQLADRAGISQGTLSKLERELALDGDKAASLADALDVPVSYFTTPRPMPVARTFHRKRASLPISDDKRIRAQASLAQDQAARVLGDRLPPLNLRREPVPDDRYFTPADIAEKVRADWKLPPGPIADLTKVVEEAGILVLPRDLDSMKIDAIATWPSDGIPVVVLSNRAPADRQRFTLAHEIGHAVMHSTPSDDQEREADEFAAEFLMPAADIRDDLRDLGLASLARLKAKWGVSMAALARRARDLGLMTDNAYRNFNLHMSSTGMNRAEPVTLDPEVPRLVHDQVIALVNAGATPEHLADQALMSLTEFRATFLEAAQ